MYLTQCFPLSVGQCYVSHNEYYNNKHHNHIPVYLSYDFQNKTEQNEKNGDCQIQNITYLTQCFPLSVGQCYVSHNEYYNNKHHNHIPVYLSYDFQFQQKTFWINLTLKYSQHDVCLER